MISVNKILILFLSILTVTFFGLWQFVQSETFAKFTSKVVTRYGQEYLDADVKFERINFRLYPPGLEVINLKFNSINSNKFSTMVSELGISFSLFDIFKTDLVIDRLYLNDGFVRLDLAENNTTTIDDNPSDKFQINKTVNMYLEKLPFELKNIELSKIDVEFNQKRLTVNKINLEINESSLGVVANVRSFNLNQFDLTNTAIDEIYLEAEVLDEKLNLNLLSLEKDMNKVKIDGNVINFLNADAAEVDLNVEITGLINDLHKYLDFSKVGRLEEGHLKLNSKIKGNLRSWTSSINLELDKFRTSFVDGNKLSLKANANSEKIQVESFYLEHKNGNLAGNKPFEFFNLKSKKFVEENIHAEAKNFELKNGLKYINEVLGIMNAQITGQLDFRLGENDFEFNLSDGFTLQGFKLQTSETFAILDIPQLSLFASSFLIKNSDVFIKTNIRGDKIDLKLEGSVVGGDVNFKSENGKINLQALGKIAGFDIQGIGSVNVEVVANSKSKFLKIENDLASFSFNDFYQQKLNSTFELDFDKNNLSVRKIIAQTGNTKTFGDLKINLEDLNIDARVEQKDINVNDIKLMYPHLLGSYDWLESDLIYGEWSLKAALMGKLTLDELLAEVKFYGINNLIHEETFDLIEISANLTKSKFTISDCKFTKPSGHLNLGLQYNINDKGLTTWGSLLHIPLFEINNYQKIPATLQGKLNGHFRAKLQNDRFDLSTEIAVSDSSAQGKKVSDSILKIEAKEDVISYNISLLGDSIASNGQIYIGASSKRTSAIDFQVNSEDINELLALIAVVDIYKTGIEGKINSIGSIKFEIDDWKKFDANLKIQRVELNKNEIKLNYINKENDQIVVSKGKIEVWDLELRGSKIYLVSKGTGDLTDKYDIQTRARIDASLLEIFNLVFSKVSGTILASIHNYKTIFNEDYEAKLVSNNLEMSSDHFPVSLTRGDLLVNYRNQKLVLNKLTAQLNTGEFNAEGEIDFSRVLPALNIRYEFKNAGFPIMKKSFLSFSGKGAIAGRTFPYSLGGDFNILKFNFVNEITDFMGGEKIAVADIDYLPTDKSRAINQFINLNINITTTEPIRITNSMSNLGFVGNLSVSGGERDPRISGKISLAPMKNEIFFKNNKFLITKGNIFFYERNKITNPELDFLATTTINKHNINISVLGPVKQFKMDLSSDPVLAQNDILSLVAFGFTEDVSTNLSDQEKESMTRAGVGSIIFDRFKINETLKNEFGLQVNLGTEIQQQQMSLLSQRNAEGTDVLGRTRSATTIEIKKQISDAIDLSVTSTVGTSVGQRQSMNLNYNINKNVSLEGVYENVTDIQTSDLSTESTSLGADVKLRWSFK